MNLSDANAPTRKALEAAARAVLAAISRRNSIIAGVPDTGARVDEFDHMEADEHALAAITAYLDALAGEDGVEHIARAMALRAGTGDMRYSTSARATLAAMRPETEGA
jgi:hypothetical protein